MLIKNKLEFPRVTKHNSAEFQADLVLALEFSRDLRSGAMFQLEFLREGKKRNIPQGGFKKVCPTNSMFDPRN